MTERTEKKRSGGRLLIIALAIALGAWVVLREREKPPLPRDENALTCIAPTGSVSSVGRFEWKFELPAGGTFELRLYDNSYVVLGELPDLTETFYELDPAVAEQLPEAFIWEIIAHDADGTDLGICRSEVTRL